VITSKCNNVYLVAKDYMFTNNMLTCSRNKV